MKKIILYALLALGLGALVAQAQSNTDQDYIKKRKALEKQLRRELNDRAGKIARREGNRLIDEGWQSAAGDLPLKKKLDNYYMKLQEEDNEGNPLWFTSFAQATANTQAAAKISAMELAKLDLAGQLGSNITGLVENSVANNQLTEEEATSIQKVIVASNNVISASLGRVLTFVEIYKPVGDGSIKCAVHIGTNAKLAEQAAKKAIRKKLEEETNVVREKLDKILGLDEEKK